MKVRSRWADVHTIEEPATSHVGGSPLSVIIVAHDAGPHVGACIDSVTSLSDDIIVVDSYSRDQTPEICLRKGVRFFQRACASFLEQFEYAQPLARHDWILLLDANEQLSPELAASIRDEYARDPAAGSVYALQVRRARPVWPTWLDRWRADFQPRLFTRHPSRGTPARTEPAASPSPTRRLPGSILRGRAIVPPAPTVSAAAAG